MTSHTVSAVIPARGRPELLSRAVESALNQTLRPSEIILVDDGSPEPLVEALPQKQLEAVTTVRYTPGRNAAYARNRGIEAARGTYVAFLDSDDWWAPNHLATSVGLLDRNQWIGLFGVYWAVGFAGVECSRRPTKLPEAGELVSDYLFSRGGSTRTSTMVFRRDAAFAVRFDERLAKHQDWDFAIRADRTGTVGCNREPTVYIDHRATSRITGKTNTDATRVFYETHRSGFSRSQRVGALLRTARHALEKGDGAAARRIVANLEDQLTFRERATLAIVWALSTHSLLPRTIITTYRSVQRVMLSNSER